jgi:hypothetical protein
LNFTHNYQDTTENFQFEKWSNKFLL